MSDTYENNYLVQRLRFARESKSPLDAAWFIQTETDIIALLEGNHRLQEECDRLRKIVDFTEMKDRLDKLSAEVRELRAEKRLNRRGLEVVEGDGK